KKRLSPDAEAQRYCEAGLDKDGFEVKYISDYKGFGVFSVAEHAKGDFLLQYAGEKITKNEATERMKKSTENKFFFYCYKGQDLCIDAEGEQEFEDDDCDDIDDDPFDIRKISDVSSEEDYISDSCSDSLQSEIIQQLCFKTKNFKQMDLEQREENTGEVFNEDDGVVKKECLSYSVSDILI
uniref:SET domain-containing protein n=1 Tax=Magallana gigas TaxID=29159 RepID=A0A8W8NKX8_MAGGI